MNGVNMTWLNNKIPPPLVFLLFAVMMKLLSEDTFIPLLPEGVRITLVSIIGGLGVLLGGAGVFEFKRVKTTVNPLKPELATSLVSSGVYGVTRNPMYLGLAFLLIAFSIYLSAPVSLVGVIGFVLYINQFQIKSEERAMAAHFGKAFADYRSRVRRWI